MRLLRTELLPNLAILLLFLALGGVLREMLEFLLENACESFEFEALREDFVGVILNQGLIFDEF